MFTISDYSSIGKNLWIIPKPPYIAKCLAILYSVTVSIGDETIGIFKGIFLLNFVDKSHS